MVVGVTDSDDVWHSNSLKTKTQISNATSKQHGPIKTDPDAAPTSFHSQRVAVDVGMPKTRAQVTNRSARCCISLHLPICVAVTQALPPAFNFARRQAQLWRAESRPEPLRGVAPPCSARIRTSANRLGNRMLHPLQQRQVTMLQRVQQRQVTMLARHLQPACRQRDSQHPLPNSCSMLMLTSPQTVPRASNM